MRGRLKLYNFFTQHGKACMRYHIIESSNHRHSASDKQIEPCSELLDRLTMHLTLESTLLDHWIRDYDPALQQQRLRDPHRQTMVCGCSGIENPCDEAIRETPCQYATPRRVSIPLSRADKPQGGSDGEPWCYDLKTLRRSPRYSINQPFPNPTPSVGILG